ncbi:helix-turn-helix domain-containing protein [Actinomadura rudentiformis]|uniref:Helix-turn-helix domain-containing protein n=1 Tax=Actinomadura rudentiformis TaxID=359158 RepID=A0A6H9YWA4_9ACTN|nr:helix-turn-helix transcriptional regulator [Actinomadura rudentiformis]KAB2348261.1 helix-turn-helix domain-containing protein [Actinomadura rudentiformis]
MGQPVESASPLRGGPTVQRILLGTRLRQLREARGINAEEAGYEIRGSHSKISRMELGRLSFKERDVADLLTLYGVTDESERKSLLAIARQSNKPGWWHQYADILPPGLDSYIGLEEAASLIRRFEASHIPDLLQTPDYARAVETAKDPDADPNNIERQVALKLRRQELLREQGGPTLWFVLDEAVIRRPLGGEKTMHAQLEHLIELSRLPNVQLQVIPFSVPHPKQVGSFTYLRFANPHLSDLVHLERLTSSAFIDRPDDVEAYKAEIDTLSVQALRAEDTRHFLSEVAAHLRS